MSSGITLGKLTIRNFFSIGNITQIINLSLYDLVLIIGENLDIGGANSRNGVGKTTIIQAISYVLFGEPLAKVRLDNCVNNINNKAMLVTLEFESNGIAYVIERGRKPNVLKLLVDGKQLDEAKGTSRNTQEDIEKIIGMSHLMFKHVVALNTYTLPFMRLEPAKQREVIEELLGITQLSQRAVALKAIMDQTKEALRDEEAAIKANTEANVRIQQAIDRAKAEADAWQNAHDNLVNRLLADAEAMSEIDVETELSIFDQIATWNLQKKSIDDAIEHTRQVKQTCVTEVARLRSETTRYEDEAARVDNGEIARLEAQVRRYQSEAEEDITPQLNRLQAEAERKRNDITVKFTQVSQISSEMETVTHQIDHPDTHTCSTCGQGLTGTDHLATIITRLNARLADLEAQTKKINQEIDSRNQEAEDIDNEIEQTKERHALKRDEARQKAVAIQQDIKVARTVLERQKEAAAGRVTELQEMVEAMAEKLTANDLLHLDAVANLKALGDRPKSGYPTREAVLAVQKERDQLFNRIENEIAKQNVHLTKIDGLQSTLAAIDYDAVNMLTLKLKHEAFLYKLLTAKDSFIRKRIVDQNLMYLNNRLNFYLERIGLPHEVKFQADLTVDISLLGRDLDFEQLSGGERNRIVVATFWAFRDVWESLNSAFNLLFADEIIDVGFDQFGAESAFLMMKEMAISRSMNIFLVSHKEELREQIENVLIVRKEDQFTTFVTQ